MPRAANRKGWGTQDTDVLVAVTAADTTPNYLSPKLSAGAGIALSVLNPGANEQVRITASGVTERQEYHKITAAETAQGYFTLSNSPPATEVVRLNVIEGPMQINKQAVGATGATPDFDVLSSNQIHFNNNGAAVGLSGDLTTDDIVMVRYES